MNDFERIAFKHGLTMKPMGKTHAEAVSALGGAHTGGVCGALTILYLSRYVVRLKKGDDLFNDHTFGQLLLQEAKGNKTLTGLIRQLQNAEDARAQLFERVGAAAKSMTPLNAHNAYSEMWDGVGFGNLVSSALKSLGATGLTLQGTDFSGFAATDGAAFGNIAAYVSANHGLHFIKLPNHIVGAVVHLDFAAPKVKLKFLDVNYGQAITSDPAKFKLFLAEYFKSTTVSGGFLTSGYNEKGQKAGVVHFTF